MTSTLVKNSILNMFKMQNMLNLTAPPARSLYTIIGPGGKCASASRIVDNRVVIFPPDLRIKESKSNGLGAGPGCCGCKLDGPICGCMSMSGGSSGCNGGSSSSLESSYPAEQNLR